MAKLQKGVNDLKTWCLNNGDFGSQLMTEWTGQCEDGKHYEMDEVAFGSHNKIKWRCSEGHEWFAVINSRTGQKCGCPYCSNDMRGARTSKSRLHKGANDLQTWCLNNGYFGQQLLNEWTGECDDGKHYEIDEVSRTSHKKFKWKCSEGHEWYTAVVNRTSHKSCCSYCSGRCVSDKNNLKTWCLNNGDFGQQLMQEWTGECEDGKHYEIDEVSFGSQKKFKWKCNEGHEWSALVVTRTHVKTGCPYCSNKGTSYPEQFIYWSLKQIYPNTENRCRVLKSPQNPQGIEFDIGIPDIPLCIEYSPTYWHGENQERDNYKKELCEKANVRLIQIIEDSYNELEYSISDTYICFKMDRSKQDEILGYIVDYILKSIGHSISEIDIDLVKQNACEYSKGKVEYEKSLEFNYPELAKEWHQTINNDLKPADVTCSSSRKVYWQCQKCNYGSDGEWRATVYRRASQKSGCPKCCYNWSDGKLHTTTSTVVTKGVNDLQSQCPELAKEWHPTLNKDLKPDKIKCGSHTKIYWQCQKCEYGSNGNWQTTVNARTAHKSGCPNCGHNWYKSQQGLPQKYKGKYSYLNDHQTP